MQYEITMPKLGLTMTHGIVTRWLKKVGDTVMTGEVVVEIETDKINTEVESPVDGIILKLLVEEGEEREITTPLCTIGDLIQADPRIFITPIARMIARENNLDYTGINGTGPNGRIVKKDILEVLKSKEKKVKEKEVEEKKAEEKEVYVPVSETANRVPLSATRKIIARRLSQSKHDIPHVYFKSAVDATNLISLKNELSDMMKAKTGKKPSINDFIIKAAAVCLAEFPDLNASLDGDDIIYHCDINIGIAVSTEKGLAVPVIKNADKRLLSDISRTAGELAEKARSGRLEPDDVSGGTFTVSNLGTYGIDEFSAVINPPESAILAVGTAKEVPWAEDGRIVVKTAMSLTLSVDHRLIDGVLAARFMKRLKELLEAPCQLLIQGW